MTLGLLPILLISTSLMAKDPCKGIKFVEDPFTKATTCSGKSVFMSRWEAKYENGVTQFSINLEVEDWHDVPLAAGTKVMLLLEDGTVVELVTSEAIAPVGGTEWDISTSWVARFELTASTLAQLASQKVTKIRAPLPSGEETFTLVGMDQKWLKNLLTCLASRTPAD